MVNASTRDKAYRKLRCRIAAVLVHGMGEVNMTFLDVSNVLEVPVEKIRNIILGLVSGDLEVSLEEISDFFCALGLSPHFHFEHFRPELKIQEKQ